MKLFLKILFFILAIFSTNIGKAKIFVFAEVVSETTINNVKQNNFELLSTILENAFASETFSSYSNKISLVTHSSKDPSYSLSRIMEKAERRETDRRITLVSSTTFRTDIVMPNPELVSVYRLVDGFIPEGTKHSMSLYGDTVPSDSVWLEKRPWGIFQLGLLAAFEQGDTLRQAGLMGVPIRSKLKSSIG